MNTTQFGFFFVIGIIVIIALVAAIIISIIHSIFPIILFILVSYLFYRFFFKKNLCNKNFCDNEKNEKESSQGKIKKIAVLSTSNISDCFTNFRNLYDLCASKNDVSAILYFCDGEGIDEKLFQVYSEDLLAILKKYNVLLITYLVKDAKNENAQLFMMGNFLFMSQNATITPKFQEEIFCRNKKWHEEKKEINGKIAFEKGLIENFGGIFVIHNFMTKFFECTNEEIYLFDGQKTKKRYFDALKKFIQSIFFDKII